MQSCPSLPLLSGRHEIRLFRGLPVWRQNRALPARAQSHRTWLLASQPRRIGGFSVCGFCSASQEIDAVTNLPRFLEIEIAGRDFHFALEILKGLAHFPSTCGHAL